MRLPNCSLELSRSGAQRLVSLQLQANRPIYLISITSSVQVQVNDWPMYLFSIQENQLQLKDQVSQKFIKPFSMKIFIKLIFL